MSLSLRMLLLCRRERILRERRLMFGAVGIIGTFTRIIKRKKNHFLRFFLVSFYFVFFYFEPFFSSLTLISVILKRFRELHGSRCGDDVNRLSPNDSSRGFACNDKNVTTFRVWNLNDKSVIVLLEYFK